MTDPSPPIALQPVRVTPILLGICVVVFIAMVASGISAFEPQVDQLIHWGANYGPRTLTGEWWRLVTSMFVHIGLIHLLLNGYCLFQLGTLAESLFGARRFAALYLLSGLGGSLLSLAIHPLTVAAGASGAIFGVAGALLALHKRKLVDRLPSMRAALRSIVPFVLYNLAAGLRPGIDNAAHVGGLMTGLALGTLLPLQTAADDSAQRRATQAISGVMAILVAAWVAVSRLQAPIARFHAAALLVDSGNASAGLPVLRRVAAQRPRFAQAQFAIGIALVQLDSAEQALGPLREAVRLDSTNSAYVDEIGIAFYHLRQWDSANANFARALRLDPTSVRAAFNSGLALVNGGHPEAAIERFRSVIAQEPDSQRVRRILGEAYLEADSVRQAIAELDTVLARSPLDAIAHYFRGTAYERLKDVARARIDLETAAATTDTSREARAYAARARDILQHLLQPPAPRE